MLPLACLLVKQIRIRYSALERTFDVRTETRVGDWVRIGADEKRAYLAVPESGSGAGVLVLHAWWGLTEVFTGVCDQLADAGFVALAPDLYANGETADSITEAEKLVGKHDATPEATERIALAATDYLHDLAATTDDRIGAVGFSMGAWWALRLSQLRPERVGAAVVFYGSGDGDFGVAQAAYQGHFAEHDDFEPLADVRALADTIREAGREVEFYVYPDTGHWFFEPNQPDAYAAPAAALAWERTLAFLEDRLG